MAQARTQEEVAARSARSRAYNEQWKARDPEGYRAYHKKYMAEYYQRRKAAGDAWQPKRTKNPQHAPNYGVTQRMKKYGITLEDYEALREIVPGCAICGNLPSHPYELRVDHDHVTGRVRGLLCDTCNRGIGFMKESSKSMAAAIEYLGG